MRGFFAKETQVVGFMMAGIPKMLWTGGEATLRSFYGSVKHFLAM
jgi:hypothetical protein